MKKSLLDNLIGLLILLAITALAGMVILDFDRHHPIKPGTGFSLPR